MRRCYNVRRLMLPETRDAVTITFAVPQALQEAYRFRPG
ncbi:hypothetical protein P7F73_08065, partial [Enterobacter sp. EC-ML 621]